MTNVSYTHNDGHATSQEPAAATPNTAYYVGDLCYIIRDDAQWDKLVRDLYAVGDGAARAGMKLSVGDHDVWVATTAHGDGVYALRDAHGDAVAAIPVDSGTIGVAPMSLLTEMIPSADFHTIEAASFPQCSVGTHNEEDGFFRIGNYTIRTGAL
jgi:hypothetical protein